MLVPYSLKIIPKDWDWTIGEQRTMHSPFNWPKQPTSLYRGPKSPVGSWVHGNTRVSVTNSSDPRPPKDAEMPDRVRVHLSVHLFFLAFHQEEPPPASDTSLVERINTSCLSCLLGKRPPACLPADPRNCLLPVVPVRGACLLSYRPEELPPTSNTSLVEQINSSSS